MADHADEHEASASQREREVSELAEEQEREADTLARRGDELEREVGAAREDWRRKRADPAVPGAQLPEDGEPTGVDHSPGPEAPPQEEEPARARPPAAGPPADADDR